MPSVPGFNISPSSDASYNFVSDVSGTYNMIRFKQGTFTVQPTSTIQLYDLFLVAGGANGTTAGGNGGEVIDLSFNTPLTVNSTYSFSLTVGSGTQDSSSNVIHNSILYTDLTATAKGGGGPTEAIYRPNARASQGGGGGHVCPASKCHRDVPNAVV